jgi:hypothetical protein
VVAAVAAVVARRWRWRRRFADRGLHQRTIAYASDRPVRERRAFDLRGRSALQSPKTGSPAQAERVHDDDPTWVDYIWAFARVDDLDVLLLGETYARDGHQRRGNEAQLDEFHIGAPHSRFGKNRSERKPNDRCKHASIGGRLGKRGTKRFYLPA